MSQPLVSVVMPNYNYGAYLAKSIYSALVQSHQNIEILVTDDGSKDNSPDIIREFANKDARVKPTLFPKNKGVKAAFIDALSRSSGKYILCLSSDDFLISKDFFQHAVAALEGDDRPAGYYGICGQYLSEKEQLVGAMSTAVVKGYNTPLQCAQGLLTHRGVITGLSSLWRRDLFLKFGGADEALFDVLGPQIDYYLFHAMAFVHGVVYEPIPYACQRVYDKKGNYGSTKSYESFDKRMKAVESRLRQHITPYPEMEEHWKIWRYLVDQDFINKLNGAY